ncbi:NACHT, LRR and PYD domains-containing protein 3-like [Dendronephthya gigantea]|uniref:NACHT, LRR and PYD domains-containing protein 3-like n=1 Tax=Dendronephthya gigantea TaxID=151771 RepID=UPI00106C809C|nr:NACHT, LRR and PYD domains-containing protein 3-like [Dendronephthya gigantea]
MMDGIKEYMKPKRFSILSYICVVIHFHCGVIFTAITTALRLSEMEKFSCAVDTKHATHKSYVEKTCFSIYDDEYNSPVKFSAFVLFNFGSVVVVSVVYSLAVGNRIEDAERLSGGSDKPQTVAKKGNNEQGRKNFYVFNFYLFHVVARSMLCILFTILQHTVLYPSGFDTQFSCVYPELRSVDPNMTPANNGSANLSSVKCTNSAAKDKQFWLTIVSVCNGFNAIIALAEVIYLLVKRFACFAPQSSVAWSCDLQFIIEHFLREQHVPDEVELISISNCTPNSRDIYKRKVLQLGLTPDINYGSKHTPLDDMFIDLVIHTEQAPHKFSKGMDRHEIYDVYTKVPKNSLHLTEIKELFYPNKDTKDTIPSTILVIGRPGIGKTVLTRKIMQDWAKGDDEIYHNKIAFYFKFRWFNLAQMQHVTLKKFLQFGTELQNEDEFESIFEEIWENPKNATLVFDGLDEFGANHEGFQKVLDQSRMFPNDVSCCMSAIILFIKILSGDMLPGATVLVTSRPTVNDVLCKIKFDRTVEIVGFTSDKIEQYVKQFCANHNKCDLEATILSHIKSSSELMNLCYIPVNCFIVCVSLFEYLIDSEGDIGALPTTLTELYQLALVYFNKHHDRNQSKDVLKKLQRLAFNGIKNDELIFNGELVDEKMEESGLLNSLPNPIFQIQIQVCFLHLTIQEFLAAKHIVETKTPEEVKEFIISHFNHGRWHLVLQFLAGLLGVKMRTSDDSHQYRSCVLSFKKYLAILGTKCDIRPNHILVMKCLREAQDEDVAKEIAANSALKDVTEIWCSGFGIQRLSRSDVAAMPFVCKHLNFLNCLHIRGVSSDCLMEALKLLHGRCMESLRFIRCNLHDMGVKRCATALTSECQLNHSHSKLAKLSLARNNISDAGVAYLNDFLQNSHKVCLEDLDLSDNDITSCGIPALLEFLSVEVCNQLTELNLGGNDIGDEGVRFLCSGIRERRLKLEKLNLCGCLTYENVLWLVELISDEHCRITDLEISGSKIGDKGMEMLFDVFRQETCKITTLNIRSCHLTEKSMVAFGKALNEGKCGLKKLNLSDNKIRDEGMRILCSVLEQGKCNLTRLDVSCCSLTDECMPSLCQALGDERCKLTKLYVNSNGITDKHLSLLSDTLKFQNCSLNYLNIKSSTTEAGEKILNETMRSDICKERGLKIYCMSNITVC